MASRGAEGGRQEVHRPGVYKQQNKPHKHGRHRTKGQLDVAHKGKVDVKTVSKKARRELRRQQRRNQAKQIRDRKRTEVQFGKRGLGGNDDAPFLTAVISLSSEVDPNALLEMFKTCDADAEWKHSPSGLFHVDMPRFKQRFTFLNVSTDNVDAVLDAAKVVDTITFLYPLDGLLDPDVETLLVALIAQGLPNTVHVALCPTSVTQKKKSDVKRTLTKVVERRFPKEKLHFMEKESDALLLMRQIGSRKLRSVFYRDRRAHVLAERVEFENEEEDKGTLKVTGYVHGKTLLVDRLVHVPCWGTYQLKRIEVLNDPRSFESSRRKATLKKQFSWYDSDAAFMVKDPKPERQETLESENVPDPMEGEQTWPTEDELKAAEEERKIRKTIRVPKGTSEYQAAWIVENSDDEDDGDGSSDDEDEMMEDALMEAMEEDASGGDEHDDDDEEYETLTVTEMGDDAAYDERMDMTEEQEMLQKFKAARMDEMFPDEVDTPCDAPARTRFQKYRGLKSFRTSPWDPKENLPADYARVYQFENFNRTRKRVLAEASDDTDENMEGAARDWYVTLHIKDFPRALWESYSPDRPLVVYQPLQHEQKMSVLNMVVRRCPHNTEPIRSKERLVFHVGYRRFSACPVFSQHTNGTKHKYERFFRNDTVTVATVYAPVTFSPCPVLVFKEKPDGTQSLVATGSVLDANPDRIVSKRAVLSGHPYKINKKTVTVRFMFFNKEDIEWFKPVELRTKLGRRGHIKKSIGTHGHMKCYFDKQLESQDVVLMNLYKRVFPKWTYEPVVGYTMNFSREEAEMEDEANSRLFD